MLEGRIGKDEGDCFACEEYCQARLPIVFQGMLSDLRINVEKLMLENPDYVVLVTHSPPYGVADYSTSITLKEMLLLEVLEARRRFAKITDSLSLKANLGLSSKFGNSEDDK